MGPTDFNLAEFFSLVKENKVKNKAESDKRGGAFVLLLLF